MKVSDQLREVGKKNIFEIVFMTDKQSCPKGRQNCFAPTRTKTDNLTGRPRGEKEKETDTRTTRKRCTVKRGAE